MVDLPALEPYFESEGRKLVLHQDRYWWDIDGRRWPLELMDFDYLRNVCRFLETQAGRLYQIEIARAVVSDGGLEAPPTDLDPVAWIRSTVLHRAIRRRIADWPRLERQRS
ncbi:MAG: hypothetical protein BroJett024_43110 [Alphaproteobacteria bacterium]|nr:MAG: hypothetical protein BroJett024_43110 [Alphaproteobacteria bacterium]